MTNSSPMTFSPAAKALTDKCDGCALLKDPRLAAHIQSGCTSLMQTYVDGLGLKNAKGERLKVPTPEEIATMPEAKRPDYIEFRRRIQEQMLQQATKG